MNPSRYILFTLAVIHASVVLAGGTIDETRAVAPDALIDIEVTNGIVTLTGWDREEFHISGELGDAVDGFNLREINGGIRFHEESDRPLRRNCWGWNGCNNDPGDVSVLDIRVPVRSVLRFEGLNAEVSASGLQGNTSIEVINGEIRISQVSGVVNVETVNGSIDATDLGGRVSLETVNGSIDDLGSSGTRLDLSTTNGDITSSSRSPRVSAETVNGDIELMLGAVDELEMSTVGGRIEVDVALNPSAQLDISSVNGRVDLTLPADTSTRFSLSTAVGGKIDNRLSNDQAVRENRYVNSSELNFSLNGGDSNVHISTVSGNIVLRSK